MILQCALRLATKGVLAKIGYGEMLNPILKIETAIAVIIVLYILIRYLKFLKIVGSRN